MKNKLYNLTLITAVLLCCADLFAGITGSLAGFVRDNETGNALSGANIIVKGTTLGTMAARNGSFLIQNLPAGTYDIEARMIGYSQFIYQDVRINVD